MSDKEKGTARQFLKKAYRELKHERFYEALAYAEKAGEELPDLSWPYFIAAVCYVYLGRFTEAESSMRLCEKNDHDFFPLAELKVFLALKSAPSREGALQIAADTLTRFPESIHIKKLLHHAEGFSGFSEFQKKARLRDYVTIPLPPKLSKSPARKKRRDRSAGKRVKRIAPSVAIGRILLFSVVVLLLVLAAFFFYRRVAEKRGGTALLDTVVLSGGEMDMLGGKKREDSAPEYITSAEVRADFLRARNMIKSGKKNEAVVLLNDIHASNAGFTVREKVDFLIRYVIDDRDRTYETLPPEKLQHAPWRYKGYAVQWQGKVANISHGEASTAFTLLLNYEEGTLAGVVSVLANRAYGDLENGAPVQVQGILLGSPEKGERLYLQGRAITILP